MRSTNIIISLSTLILFAFYKLGAKSPNQIGNECFWGWQKKFIKNDDGKLKVYIEEDGRTAFHLTLIRIDSTGSSYINRYPAFGKKGDTTLSSSDGGLFVGKGTATFSKDSIVIQGKWTALYYVGVRDSNFSITLKMKNRAYYLEGIQKTKFHKDARCSDNKTFFQSWIDDKRYNGSR